MTAWGGAIRPMNRRWRSSWIRAWQFSLRPVRYLASRPRSKVESRRPSGQTHRRTTIRSISPEGIQETTDMSAKSNLAVKDVKFEVAARERMIPRINILAEAVKMALDTRFNVVESLQFERGYN
jgi:hypothetical protein